MHPNRLSQGSREAAAPPRMNYRSQPVSVAVDPVSLIISECVSITTEIRKRTPSHITASAILGSNPNTTFQARDVGTNNWKRNADGGSDLGGQQGPGNRWGLRAGKGGSAHDNPLISSFGQLRYALSGTKGLILWRKGICSDKRRNG
jgi:brefeldin A-resistance guanine nucleotide exchange factor 1